MARIQSGDEVSLMKGNKKQLVKYGLVGLIIPLTTLLTYMIGYKVILNIGWVMTFVIWLIMYFIGKYKQKTNEEEQKSQIWEQIQQKHMEEIKMFEKRPQEENIIPKPTETKYQTPNDEETSKNVMHIITRLKKLKKEIQEKKDEYYQMQEDLKYEIGDI